jgi:TonB family protein
MKKFNHIKIPSITLLTALTFLWVQPLLSQTTPPSCYGSNRLLKAFIHEEMIYPNKALQQNTEGTVILEFIVLKTGHVCNLEVIQSVSDEIDEEAIRLFNHILWHPATQLGTPVDYLYTFEIKFKIGKYLKYCKQRGYEHYELPFKPVDSSNLVYERKDIDDYPRPVFKEKDMNFGRFITKELVYPEDAFKGNVSGIVELLFIVEPTGRISNIEVMNAVGGGCTEEAIRVVKKLRWFPGIKDNKAVRTIMPLDLRFDIAKKSVSGTIPSPGQFH